MTRDSDMNARCSPYVRLHRGARVGCVPVRDLAAALRERREINGANGGDADDIAECSAPVCNDDDSDAACAQKAAAHATRTHGCAPDDGECILDALAQNVPCARKAVDRVRRRAFKPAAPSQWEQCRGRNVLKCEYMWLSNHDIDDVMCNYMDAYDNFYFLGTFMIDFTETRRNIRRDHVDLAALDLDAFPHERCVLGMIINTARTGHSGEHWVALAVHFDRTLGRGEVNYFNSAGILAPIYPSVLKAFEQLAISGKRSHITFTFRSSHVIHQLQKSECGVYCLYFLVHTLNHAFDSIRSRITDRDIFQYRYKYWQTPK